MRENLRLAQVVNFTNLDRKTFCLHFSKKYTTKLSFAFRKHLDCFMIDYLCYIKMFSELLV